MLESELPKDFWFTALQPIFVFAQKRIHLWRTPIRMSFALANEFRLSFWYVIGRDKWKRMEQKKKKSITIWGYSEGFKIDLPKNLNRDLRYCSSSRQV